MSKSKPFVKQTCELCGQTFSGRPGRKTCAGCSKLGAPKRRSKYPITAGVKQLFIERYDSRVPGGAAEIARELVWPDWMVNRTAKRLGLTHPWPAGRRNWTPKEVRYLEKWQGLRSAKWIAKKLGRGETSVVLKFKRLGLSRRVQNNGYCVRDLTQLFGVDHHSIDRWIELGYLRLERPAGKGKTRQISREAILEFIRDHRAEWRLDKVEQGAFLELLFGPEEEAGKTLGELLEYRPDSKSAGRLTAEFAEVEALRENSPTPEEIAREGAAVRKSRQGPWGSWRGHKPCDRDETAEEAAGLDELDGPPAEYLSALRG